MHTNRILADARWDGPTGMGRYSREVLARLQQTDQLTSGPRPLSIANLIWQSYILSRKQKHRIFFTPGFNPPLYSAIPFVFTLHDLIHLTVPNRYYYLHKLFYEAVIKPAAKCARQIVTSSQYSKSTIIDWAGVHPEKVIVSNAAASDVFSVQGDIYRPGFPYLLNVSNNKPHKNIERLIRAMAVAQLDGIHLICTGRRTASLEKVIIQYQLDTRVHFHNGLSETTLAAYYRGASAVVLPSLYEGFGIPVLEGMASGIPVLTSNVTSLPEVAGHAAMLVDPHSLESLINGLEKIVQNTAFRSTCMTEGLAQAKNFSWDKTAGIIQTMLDDCSE